MEENRTKAVMSAFTTAFVALIIAAAGCQADSTRTTGFRQENGSLAAYAGDDIVLRYRYEGVPFKPYIQELLTPSGVNVLRDAPADHLHHHALMFAVAVDGVNFWEEQQQPGRQTHRSFAPYVKVGDEKTSQAAALQEQLDWVNPRTDEVLLKEVRTIRILPGKDRNVTLVTWQAELRPPAGKDSATLSGSAYFGLGMRFVTSMDTGGEFINANGTTGVDGTNDKRAKWCAYRAAAGGKPVTIAVFDHPTNARHPATWFTMDTPFAYLAATLGLHKQPLKVTSDKPFVLRYGVALWDGLVEANSIDRLCTNWIAGSKDSEQSRK